MIPVSQTWEEKRPANAFEMPSKLVEPVRPHKTTEMQADLLPRRKKIILDCQRFLKSAIGACHIHKQVTNWSYKDWVRSSPDYAMRFCTMFLRFFLGAGRLVQPSGPDKSG